MYSQLFDMPGVSFFFFFPFFLGMKNRGSMEPVQRGGPWTWDPGFVLSQRSRLVQVPGGGGLRYDNDGGTSRTI